VRRVRHIEAENVDARVHELANHLGGIGGGAECGNDFCPANGSLSHGQNILLRYTMKSFFIAQKSRRQIELAFGGNCGQIPPPNLN
jgi:hypothetical protein